MDPYSSSVFLDSRRLCSDSCANEAKDIQNEQIEKYELYYYLPVECDSAHARFPEFAYEHVNLTGRIGYGLSDSCTIDTYSELMSDPAQLTRDKCRIQLFTRIFTGCPNLRPGVGDPNAELDILSGSSSDDNSPFGSCKREITEEQTYHPTPMLDCIKSVQDPKHVVEPWTRGGDNTRDFIRRQEWLKQCEAQTFNREPCHKKMH